MAGQKFVNGAGTGSNFAANTFAVWGDSDNASGVIGTSTRFGVFGMSEGQDTSVGPFGIGIAGTHNGPTGFGVRGTLSDPLAVGAGVAGFCSSAAIGVQGESRSGRGVAGSSIFGPGVSGSSDNHAGVIGSAGNIGVYAENSTELTPTNTAYLGTRSAAGDFYGEVWVRGHLFKLGGGFEIDHPSDPANKYLRHSFVESSEMKNIYDGVAVLNSKGEAIVRLPTWFSELNKDFRYQLTCIGKYAPIYVSEQLRKNRFKISGGRSKLEVSWMITGVRKDAWANANRISVEVTKPKHERGYFLNPELHKVKQDKSIQRARYPEVFLSPDQRRKQLDLEKKLLAAQK